MIVQIQTAVYDRLKLWPEAWASTTAYITGDIVKASTYNSLSYECSTAGTSGASEPTWTTTEYNVQTDGTVKWVCYDPKTYNTVAPKNANVPYVSFGLLTEVPMGDFEDFEAISSLNFWINCFSSKSIADVSEITDEVMDAMDDTVVSASGFTSMKCVREFISQPTFDIETEIYQTSLRYRIWLDKT